MQGFQLQVWLSKGKPVQMAKIDALQATGLGEDLHDFQRFEEQRLTFYNSTLAKVAPEIRYGNSRDKQGVLYLYSTVYYFQGYGKCEQNSNKQP